MLYDIQGGPSLLTVNPRISAQGAYFKFNIGGWGHLCEGMGGTYLIFPKSWPDGSKHLHVNNNITRVLIYKAVCIILIAAPFLFAIMFSACQTCSQTETSINMQICLYSGQG